MERLENESSKDFLNRYISDYKKNVETFLFENKDTIVDGFSLFESKPQDNNFYLSCTNVSETEEVFNSYIEGMTKFFNDLSEVDMSEEAIVEGFQEKLGNALQNKDKIFDKLFNGTYVPSGNISGTSLLENVTSIATISTDKLLELFESFYVKEEKGLYTNECKEFMMESIVKYYDTLFNYCKESLDLLTKKDDNSGMVLI